MPIPVATVSAPLTTPTTGAVVTLGSLTIVQGAVLDGVRWTLQPIAGWDDLPEVNAEVTKRPHDDGAWLGFPSLGPRVLTLEGSLIGSDWTAMARASASIMAALPIRSLVDLTVSAAAEPVLTAKVRQHGKPLVDPDGHQRRFSISLIAPDPRRYSPDVATASIGLPQNTGGLSVGSGLVVGSGGLSVGAQVYSGLMSVTNAGNESTRPVLTITGPCPPCQITHTPPPGSTSGSRRLSVPEAVPAGRTLVLDADSRTVLLDGTASRVATGSWFDLEPGVNQIAFSAPTYHSAARLTVSFRSAWR